MSSKTAAPKSVRLNDVTGVDIHPNVFQRQMASYGLSKKDKQARLDVQQKLDEIKKRVVVDGKATVMKRPDAPARIAKDANAATKAAHKEAQRVHASELKDYMKYKSADYKTLKNKHALATRLTRYADLLALPADRQAGKTYQEERARLENGYAIKEIDTGRGVKIPAKVVPGLNQETTIIAKFGTDGKLSDPTKIREAVALLYERNPDLSLFDQQDTEKGKSLQVTKSAAVVATAAVEAIIKELVGAATRIECNRLKAAADAGEEDVDVITLEERILGSAEIRSDYIRFLIDRLAVIREIRARAARRLEHNNEVRAQGNEYRAENAKTSGKKSTAAKFTPMSFEDSEVSHGKAVKIVKPLYTHTEVDDKNGNKPGSVGYKKTTVKSPKLKDGVPQTKSAYVWPSITGTGDSDFEEGQVDSFVTEFADGLYGPNTGHRQVRIKKSFRQVLALLAQQFIERMMSQIKLLTEFKDSPTVYDGEFIHCLTSILVDCNDDYTVREPHPKFKFLFAAIERTNLKFKDYQTKHKETRHKAEEKKKAAAGSANGPDAASAPAVAGEDVPATTDDF